MSNATIANIKHTVDKVYQWDVNRTLEICGLSLASAPEIHFATASMKEAIVKQSTMDAAGVITVQIPNVLLQKAEKIKVYIYVRGYDSYKTDREFTINVIARAKPSDYIMPDDDPVMGDITATHDGKGNVTIVIGG